MSLRCGRPNRPGVVVVGQDGPCVSPPCVRRQEPDPASTIKNLIAGPFYQNYPLQMFDRKVKPLSEMFIGLVEKTIVGEEDLKQLMEQHPHMLNDTPWSKVVVEECSR